MKTKLSVVFLLSSALLLSGCNLFGGNKTNGEKKNTDEPQSTPFEREYEFDQKADDGNYQIAPQSTVRWDVRGNDGNVYSGTAQIKEGSANVENGDLQNATFTVDMTTIQPDEEGSTAVTDFVKSEQYLNVQQFPQAIGKISSVEEIPESPNDFLNYEVKGEMSIMEETVEQNYDASIVETGENVIEIQAEIDVDLAELGVSESTAPNSVKRSFEFNLYLVYQPSE